MAQPAATAKRQPDALNAYNDALNRFRSVLRERRGQIDSKQGLPNLPGQALYLARNNVISTYKDLTDAVPPKSEGPINWVYLRRISMPTIEPLLDEYRKLFEIMQAPPANAQNSATPFKDVVDLGTAIARVKGLDKANSEAGGPHQSGDVFCRDQWQSEYRECALEQVQGKFSDRAA